MNEPAVEATTVPQASSSDGGAKQALENEFECTICRVSFVEVGLALIYVGSGIYVSADCTMNLAGLHGGHTLSCALWSHVLWRVFERVVAKEPIMPQV